MKTLRCTLLMLLLLVVSVPVLAQSSQFSLKLDSPFAKKRPPLFKRITMRIAEAWASDTATLRYTNAVIENVPVPLIFNQDKFMSELKKQFNLQIFGGSEYAGYYWFSNWKPSIVIRFQ